MTAVTQTIDNYYAGVSQQPDLKKFPGQVKDIVNAIPDAVEGLYKRPGAKRIGATPLTNVQSNGSWFHYYRDETEGSYIGQVASDGTVRMWSCNDGTEKTVYHGAAPWVANTAYEVGDKVQNGANIYVCDTDGTSAGSGGPSGTGADISDNSTRWDYEATVSATTTSIKNYLTPSSATAIEDIQALTINDTTFLNNRTEKVSTTGTTDATIDSYYAFLDLLRSENGRQYSLNVYDVDTEHSTSTATRIRIKSDTVPNGRTHNQGHCPATGTRVFSKDQAYSSRNCFNLIFRLTTRGASTTYINGDGGADDAADFSCIYTKDIVLLHGGEGWETGDEIVVTMEGYDYTILVTAHEETKTKGTINGGTHGIHRPDPTPFDQDTAVTTDSILGGIISEFNTMNGSINPDITYRRIGNGIYFMSTAKFNIEVVDKDLMRVMQSEVNDVSELPIQCRHGYIVKVTNSSGSDKDDYYMKFVGENNLDGPGAWKECAAPGISKGLNPTTMPHILQRVQVGSTIAFVVKENTWGEREIGDADTNPVPSFVGNEINKVLFFRNRIAVLSGPNVILSRPEELAKPSFFSKTALAVSATDPIDISCSSMFPSELYDGIEVASGLAVFSSNQQFLLSSDAEILNPDTAKLRSIATYNYNKNIPPISLGTTVGYVDNSGKYSRFNEIANIQREQEPIVVETSKLVPTLLPKNIDLLTNSRENSIVLAAKSNSNDCLVYGYKYLTYGEKREQQAWFKWKLNNPIKYHFIIDDDYYFLDTNDFLQRSSLMQKDTDPSINETVEDDTSNYLIHLDNWTTVGNGSYNSGTGITTFANQTDWIDQVTTPNGDLVLVDTNESSTRVGRYAKCTIINTDDFTVPGDWSTGTFYIGYLYEYSVHFPTIYFTQTQGQQSRSDVNSSLVIHRIKLNFGRSGLYETTLQRVSPKTNYTQEYESAALDEYNVSDAPYVPEDIQTVPVYEKNTNVEVLLKSSHPAPATLLALSWEGDYTPKNYRRV